MTDLEIREATPDDAADLAEVYHSAYREKRELGFPAKAETVAVGTVESWIREHRVLVATAAGEVVGGVRLEETGAGRVKLSRLAVRADWKGQGVGTALLDRAETRAREAGADVIWLTTPPAHPSLPDWYRRRGYERTGRYPLDYRDYDEVILEKTLD